jgi:cytochrome c-type biogenesis protein CcmE
MRTITKLGLTASVVLGGGAFLIGSSISHAEHYRMVDDLVHEGFTTWGDKEIKVHGFVESGSIAEHVVAQETQRSFVLELNGARVRVFSRGPKPDTFKDNAEVVATGHLVPASAMAGSAKALDVRADAEQAWVVDATDLMAKCPEHYKGTDVRARTPLKF